MSGTSRNIIPLEILVDKMHLLDCIKKESMETFQKLVGDFDISIAEIEFVLVDKETKKKMDELEAKMEETGRDSIDDELTEFITNLSSLGLSNRVSFKHRDSADYDSGLVVINATNEEIMKRIVENIPNI